MYNVYENREFKFSFEELYLMNSNEADKIKKDNMEKLKKIWSYFEEGKTKKEVLLLMSIPDRRTKEGKWVASIRSKYGLSNALGYASNYNFFIRREENRNRQLK